MSQTVLGPIVHSDGSSPTVFDAPDLSADSTTLAFERDAQIVVVDLVAGADAMPLIASTDQIAPLQLGAAGGGVGPSSSPVLSGDGHLVAFVSNADDLLNAAGPVGRGNSSSKGKGRPQPDGDVGGTQVLLKDLNNGGLSLVSTDNRGRPGDGPSGSPDMSGDGRLVVFQSTADNLVPRDDNDVQDVFLKDLKSGRVKLLSADRRNHPGNGASEEPSLALDGLFVALSSTANNLVEGDLNGASDVFVKNVKNGRTQLASVDADGNQLGGSGPSISGDGRYVVFLSNADVDRDGADVLANAFVRDMVTGALARLDVSASGTIANTVLTLSLGKVEISADGRTIAYYEGSRNFNIVTDDPDAAEQASNEIGAIFENDEQFFSRDVIGVTTNPLLDGAPGPEAALTLEHPAFNLALMLPAARGLSSGSTEALTLQEEGLILPVADLSSLSGRASTASSSHSCPAPTALGASRLGVARHAEDRF
jgi:Tol biopolymer transport system component